MNTDRNTASGSYSSIVSGKGKNTASGSYSAVGNVNTASCLYSTASSEYCNAASGINSPGSGGQMNQASGHAYTRKGIKFQHPLFEKIRFAIRGPKIEH